MVHFCDEARVLGTSVEVKRIDGSSCTLQHPTTTIISLYRVTQGKLVWYRRRGVCWMRERLGHSEPGGSETPHNRLQDACPTNSLLQTRSHRFPFARKTSQNFKLPQGYYTAPVSGLSSRLGGDCCCCYFNKKTSRFASVRAPAENIPESHFRDRGAARSRFLLFLLFVPPDRHPPRCRGRIVVGPPLGHNGFLHVCTHCVHLVSSLMWEELEGMIENLQYTGAGMETERVQRA